MHEFSKSQQIKELYGQLTLYVLEARIIFVKYCQNFDFKIGKHGRISYERSDYESVD